MKTAVKWLEEYLNTKVLPCPEGNDYVYGMNVAHENLINYVIPYLLEKEKEQILDAYNDGVNDGNTQGLLGKEGNGNYVTLDEYFNETYNQNK